MRGKNNGIGSAKEATITTEWIAFFAFSFKACEADFAPSSKTCSRCVSIAVNNLSPPWVHEKRQTGFASWTVQETCGDHCDHCDHHVSYTMWYSLITIIVIFVELILFYCLHLRTISHHVPTIGLVLEFALPVSVTMPIPQMHETVSYFGRLGLVMLCLTTHGWVRMGHGGNEGAHSKANIWHWFPRYWM